jgi:ATP-dependent DNA helicase RecG
MMSATPIPRTLAMSYYADLDVSVLDELPPGRTPIKTRLVADKPARGRGRLRQEACRGRPAGLLGLSADRGVRGAAVADGAGDLRNAFGRFKARPAVGLVHGRLKADERQAVMAAFAAGEIDVLVATTVIEVGVDVPNASLMVIEHAERFGLSQLHQLRGRVGRGNMNRAAC